MDNNSTKGIGKSNGQLLTIDKQIQLPTTDDQWSIIVDQWSIIVDQWSIIDHVPIPIPFPLPYKGKVMGKGVGGSLYPTNPTSITKVNF